MKTKATQITRAFRRHTSDVGFCAIGSLKSNTGHMVIAAGAAGVIKTALALRHERLPASINFTRPNPKIELDGGPFVVQSTHAAWPRSAGRCKLKPAAAVPTAAC